MCGSARAAVCLHAPRVRSSHSCVHTHVLACAHGKGKVPEAFYTASAHSHTATVCVRVNNKHARTLTHGFTYSADCAVCARLSPTIPLLLLPLHHLYAFIIVMGKNGERGTRPKRVNCSRGGLFFFVCLFAVVANHYLKCVYTMYIKWGGGVANGSKRLFYGSQERVNCYSSFRAICYGHV